MNTTKISNEGVVFSGGSAHNYVVNLFLHQFNSGSTTEAHTSVAWSGTVLLRPGPAWNSFEDFRRQGNSSLESIQARCVATLNTKVGKFRILQEPDFQHLLGLAAEVTRLQLGMKFIYQAAKVAQMHPDKESIELLIQSFSLIRPSPEPSTEEESSDTSISPTPPTLK